MMSYELRTVLVTLLILILAACGSTTDSASENSDTSNDTTTTTSTTLPSITHLPVTIAAYDAATDMAGDIDFSHATIDNTGKVFLEFQGIIRESPEERLPHFTFNLPAGTPVYSMVNGEVTAVELNDNSPDYEVRIRPTGASDFVSTYDHLDEVTVAVGDTVSGGEQLGVAVASNKFEADIADFSTSPNTAYCPVTFFAENVRAAHIATLTQLITDWETQQGDTSLYDEDAMFAAGCVSATGSL